MRLLARILRDARFAVLCVSLGAASACSDDGDVPVDAGPLDDTDDPTAKTLRRLADFTVVEHLGEMTLVISRGTVRRLSIRGPRLRHRNVSVSVNNEVLTVRCRPTGEDDVPQDCLRLTLYLRADELTEVRHYGTGALRTEGDLDSDELVVKTRTRGPIRVGLRAKSFQLVHSGDGEVELLGHVDRAHLTLSGAGSVSGPWRAETASIHLAGSGNVELTVGAVLDAHLASTGSIFFRGAPTITKRERSTGRVLPLSFE